MEPCSKLAQSYVEEGEGLSNSAQYFAAEVTRYKALDTDEVRKSLFLQWIRTTLKLDGTDQELLTGMTQYYFVWCAAWKAKS